LHKCPKLNLGRNWHIFFYRLRLTLIVTLSQNSSESTVLSDRSQIARNKISGKDCLEKIGNCLKAVINA